jgi:hypothetical protein
MRPALQEIEIVLVVRAHVRDSLRVDADRGGLVQAGKSFRRFRPDGRGKLQ